MAWYDKYTNKPPWQPPNKVFGIVWPIPYMIYAFTLYLNFDKVAVRNLLLVGLFLNFCWVPVFTMDAVAALVVLSGMVAVGVRTLMLLKGSVFWLFSAYVAWISFAWTLNAYIAMAA
jgi:benzodiazapine receptor